MMNLVGDLHLEKKTLSGGVICAAALIEMIVFGVILKWI
jgi:hypothetical protein